MQVKSPIPPPESKLTKIQKERLGVAKKFTDEVINKYKDAIKSVIIFGSVPRGEITEKSDIDMLVLVDDTKMRFTPEILDRMDWEIKGIAKSIDPRIIVQPVWTLTEFWDMARIGHPLLYTIVRDGWALHDQGFFIPVRKLLEMGKIPTTIEAIEKFMENAPKKIERVKTAKLFMVAEDLYYAMLNSAQAVLMFLRIDLPSPKNTPKVVEEHLVKTGLLEEEYLKDLDNIINFRKRVEHKEILDIQGTELDDFINKADKFVKRIEQLLSHLERERKKDVIKKNFNAIMKVTQDVLKKMKVFPKDPGEIPEVLKQEIIDRGLLPQSYKDIFLQVVTMRKMLDEGKIDTITQRELDLMNEYTRRFVRDMSDLLKKKTEDKNEAT